MIRAAFGAAPKAGRTLLVVAFFAGAALLFAPSAFAATISESPSTQQQTVGVTNATISATVSPNPGAGVPVTFTITSGPNAGLTSTSSTNASGVATLIYAGTASGQDQVVARTKSGKLGGGTGAQSSPVSVNWDLAIFPNPGLTPTTVAQGASVTFSDATDFCELLDTAPVASSNVPSDFSAIINWGDGTSSPAAITTGSAFTGEQCFNISAPHTYAHAGSYTVTETVTDVDNPTNTETQVQATVTVTGISGTGQPISVADGQTFTGATASFTDTLGTDAASRFTASINWGDGTTTPGTVSGPNGGPFTVSGSHAYADDGSYTVTTTLQDTSTGQTFTATSTAWVSEHSITATGGFTYNSTNLSGVTVATFADPNTLAVSGDYTATIDWGDATTSAGTISGGSGSFTVTGSHNYAVTGNHTISVTITDADKGVNTKTVTDSQVPPADPTIGATGSNVSGTEGANTGTVQVATFTDPDAGSTGGEYTATITWGDGGSSTGSISGPTGGPFTVTGSHVYADEGYYTVHVTITDTDNLPNAQTTTSTATVDDAALSSTGVTAHSAGKGWPGGTIAVFTDANAGATTADFTAVINWGDGSPNSAGTVTANGGGSFTVSGPAHTFATTGPHTVTVTILDDGGQSTTAFSSISTACGFGGC